MQEDVAPVLKLLRSNAFIKDLRALASVEISDVQRFADHIPTLELPVSIQSLTDAAEYFVGPNARSLGRVTWHLDNAYRESGLTRDKFTQVVTTVLRDSPPAWSPEERARTLTNIAPVMQEFEVIYLSRKLEELPYATGQRVQSFRILTDFRPVFDRSARFIAAMMPHVVLHLEVSDTDGSTRTLDITLDAEDLRDLDAALNRTRLKLDTMQAFGEGAGTSAPASPPEPVQAAVPMSMEKPND